MSSNALEHQNLSNKLNNPLLPPCKTTYACISTGKKLTILLKIWFFHQTAGPEKIVNLSFWKWITGKEMTRHNNGSIITKPESSGTPCTQTKDSITNLTSEKIVEKQFITTTLVSWPLPRFQILSMQMLLKPPNQRSFTMIQSPAPLPPSIRELIMSLVLHSMAKLELIHLWPGFQSITTTQSSQHGELTTAQAAPLINKSDEMFQLQPLLSMKNIIIEVNIFKWNVKHMQKSNELYLLFNFVI